MGGLRIEAPKVLRKKTPKGAFLEWELAFLGGCRKFFNSFSANASASISRKRILFILWLEESRWMAIILLIFEHYFTAVKSHPLITGNIPFPRRLKGGFLRPHS